MTNPPLGVDGFYIIHFKNGNSVVVIKNGDSFVSGNLESFDSDIPESIVRINNDEVTMIEQIGRAHYEALREAATMHRKMRELQTVVNFKQMYAHASNMGIVSGNQTPAPIQASAPPQAKRAEEPFMTNIRPAAVGSKTMDGKIINLPLRK